MDGKQRDTRTQGAQKKPIIIHDLFRPDFPFCRRTMLIDVRPHLCVHNSSVGRLDDNERKSTHTHSTHGCEVETPSSFIHANVVQKNPTPYLKRQHNICADAQYMIMCNVVGRRRLRRTCSAHARRATATSSTSVGTRMLLTLRPRIHSTHSIRTAYLISASCSTMQPTFKHGTARSISAQRSSTAPCAAAIAQ